MPADNRGDPPPTHPTCPLCRRPVAPGAAILREHGDVIHLACHLGLTDAAAAVARLLCERPGQPLCATCIASALDLTLDEARTGTARLRPLRGFELRFEVCVGCGARRQVLRALRDPGRRESPSSSRRWRAR